MNVDCQSVRESSSLILKRQNCWRTIQVKFAKPTLFHVSWFVRSSVMCSPRIRIRRLHAPPWSVTNILFQFRNIKHAFVSFLKNLDCRTPTAISAMHLFRPFLTIPPVIGQARTIGGSHSHSFSPSTSYRFICIFPFLLDGYWLRFFLLSLGRW